MTQISVALTKPDFLHLGEQIAQLKEAGADRLHLDIMDGSNDRRRVSYGRDFAQAVYDHARSFGLHVETHMLIDRDAIADVELYPGDTLIYHSDALGKHAHDTVVRASRRTNIPDEIKAAGKRFGLAFDIHSRPEELYDLKLTTPDGFIPLNPDQILRMEISDIALDCRFVLQNIINIVNLCNIRNVRKKPGGKYEIAVDGCMNEENARLAREAGADVVVSGSYVLGSPNSRDAIEKLRGIVSVDA